jgi:hypothetical protein
MSKVYQLLTGPQMRSRTTRLNNDLEVYTMGPPISITRTAREKYKPDTRFPSCCTSSMSRPTAGSGVKPRYAFCVTQPYACHWNKDFTRPGAPPFSGYTPANNGYTISVRISILTLGAVGSRLASVRCQNNRNRPQVVHKCLNTRAVSSTSHPTQP